MANPTIKKFKPFETSLVFRWVDPDTQRKFTASNLKSLVQLIVSYRAQNKLAPIEHLEQVLENYLCGLPENCGKCQPKPLPRSFTQYLKGGIALLKNMYYSDQNMVDQPTAEERALTCTRCPFNVFPDRGMFIKWSDDIALATVGDRKVTAQQHLGNCEVCSCPLRAKVWYKGEFGLTAEQKQLITAVTPACWQLKDK